MDLALPVGARDHVRGPADAPVTVVEYADVECPYCGRLEPVLRELLATRPVRLVYRHFPLVEPHPSAYSAALALEAAGDRFWDLHDLLFERQERLGRATFAAAAQELGLDPDSVLRPASEAYDERVREDHASGVASGVEGTPALFVNGRRYSGKLRLEPLQAAVDEVLA